MRRIASSCGRNSLPQASFRRLPNTAGRSAFAVPPDKTPFLQTGCAGTFTLLEQVKMVCLPGMAVVPLPEVIVAFAGTKLLLFGCIRICKSRRSKRFTKDVGFARSLLAYELPDGRLKLLDGHLRRDGSPFDPPQDASQDEQAEGSAEVQNSQGLLFP
jgi:hypothetical protein